MSNTVKIKGQAGTQTKGMWVTFDWIVENNGTQPGDRGKVRGITTLHDGSEKQEFHFEGVYGVLGIGVSGVTIFHIPLQDKPISIEAIIKNIVDTESPSIDEKENCFAYVGPQDWLKPIHDQPIGYLKYGDIKEEQLPLTTEVAAEVAQ